jgi:UDP-N-acetylglucosamine transferase subunit ALG13
VIFVTVGSADPFDRLIRAVDEWAGSRERTDIFAQVGNTRYEPRHMEAVRFLSPGEFRERVRAARLMVAHAGMGSIITALEAGKPIVIMPKWARLGEHRNDHQVATAKRFGQNQGVIVAWDEKDLLTKLDREEALRSQVAPETIAREASPELIATIRAFIHGAGDGGEVWISEGDRRAWKLGLKATSGE